MKKIFSLFLVFASLVSCQTKTNSNTLLSDSTVKQDKSAVPDSAAMAAPPMIFLPTLLLSKTDFDYLKAPPAHVLVFQNRYAATATGASAPNMVAYAMKQNHAQFNDNFRLLTPFSNTTEPMYGRETIFGDNQILIKELNDLIDEVTGSNGGRGMFSNFLFTPKYNATNKHIYYEITITGAAGATVVPGARFTNPSPPATAS